MCHITRLHCEVCEANSRHLFLPCEDFLADNLRDENGEVKNHIEPGKRFYCSDLKWPPHPDLDVSYWVCNACFELGRQTFNDSMKLDAYLNDPSNSQSHYVSVLHNTLLNNRSDPSRDQRAEPGLRHLPKEFEDASDTTRENLVSLYGNKKFSDQLWEDRVASSGGCYMTVWMPCCPVCKDPMTKGRRSGIVDVEIEPTSELWRWLAVHQRLAPEEAQAFEINVATGFLSKVCAICRNLEIVLRQQVQDYLQDTTRPRSWAITTWLLNRGMSDKPFYDFMFFNVGLPDTMPPSNKEIMSFMAKSWERLTNGLTFGDCIVDSDPPVSYSAPLTRHREPLLDLDQWVQLVDPYSDKELNINHPPQSLDGMAGSDGVASLISSLPAGGISDIDHDLGAGAEDDDGKNGENAPVRSDGSGIDPVEENDDDSVSSDMSYTSYEPPADMPKFHFDAKNKKPKEYIMPWRGFANLRNSNTSEPSGISTTSMLERIAIGSMDPIIALWHILGGFIKTLPPTKTIKYCGHLRADWEEAHRMLGTIVKFAATVREQPKKKYKHRLLLPGDQPNKKFEKILDTLVTDVVRESDYESERVRSDISQLPLNVLAYYHRSVAEGLLNLYGPEMTCSEGEDGSLLVTVQGAAIHGEWAIQHYRIPQQCRQLQVWKFTGPSFKESFAAAAENGDFVNVMRMSLFGEVPNKAMHRKRRANAHSRLQETQDRESLSVSKAKDKDALIIPTLANGHKSSTKKRVHFAPSPNLVEEAESSRPSWEDDQDASGPSGQYHINGPVEDEDAAMADADVIDLDDGEGAFVLCNKGGWHYHDNHGSPMGEYIPLPGLGLELEE
ncbi:hypothetical protein PG991_011189 [Apiospora marii]|uniref:Uncharacterized protein n=1 Tax=Apiospora marii TaxID=335849 RepID=A0ABR1RDJ6_9PEZI